MKLRERLEGVAWGTAGLVVGLVAWGAVAGIPHAAPPAPQQQTWEQPAADSSSPSPTFSSSPTEVPTTPAPLKVVQKVQAAPMDLPSTTEAPTTTPPPVQDTPASPDPAAEPMVTDDIQGPIYTPPPAPAPEPSEAPATHPTPTTTGQ